MATEEYKRCTKCGESKALSSFGRCSFDPRYKNQDRRREHCNACRVANAAKWQRDNADRKRANHKRWAEANPESVRASSRRYYLANPERVAAVNERCRKANPEVGRAILHARRTRLTGAGGRYTARDIEAQYAAQSGLCFYCAVPLNGVFHRDHKIPVARGGTSWPENMCCACAHCNRRKHAKTDVEFLAQLAREALAA